jgi:hypothetical protein
MYVWPSGGQHVGEDEVGDDDVGAAGMGVLKPLHRIAFLGGGFGAAAEMAGARQEQGAPAAVEDLCTARPRLTLNAERGRRAPGGRAHFRRSVLRALSTGDRQCCTRTR